MESNYFKSLEQFEKLMSKIDKTEIVCSVNVSAFFLDLQNFNYDNENHEGKIYRVGSINTIDVYCDVDMKFEDLKIFDKEKNLLLDLSEHGFENLKFEY